MPKTANKDIPAQAVWVFIEQEQGVIHSVSWELLGVAATLAVELGASVVAVIIGHDVSRLTPEIFSYGAEAVLVVDDPILEHYRAHPYSTALSTLIRKYDPSIFLLGATTIGRDLASPVATEIGTGLTADCTQLEIEPKSGLLRQTRPAFGGNIMATIICPDHRPQMATVRPRVLAIPAVRPGLTGPIVHETIEFGAEQSPTKILDFIADADADQAHIEQAEVLVCVGRGLGSADNLPLLQELASLLGGQIGGSRPVIEKGWLPASCQVGQTGKTVRPTVYIAAGISGAIQHVVGMKESDTIIAINSDPEAPIFAIADYGVVGDLLEIVPAMVEELKQRQIRPLSAPVIGGRQHDH